MTKNHVIESLDDEDESLATEKKSFSFFEISLAIGLVIMVVLSIVVSSKFLLKKSSVSAARSLESVHIK